MVFSKIIGIQSFAETTETIDVDQGLTEWNGAVHSMELRLKHRMFDW